MEFGGPERPAGVPPGSAWNASLEKWEVCSVDAEGARQGECLLYRADGTLYARSRFVGGVEEGPFAIYHPDGSVAREGAFVGGRVDGVVRSYAGGGPEAEPLRACCVPEAASRMLARFRDGELVEETFYDRDGRPILSDGNFWPPRPAVVPEDAAYDEGRAGWVSRTEALERFWTGDGALLEEVQYQGGRKQLSRCFDRAGRIVESCAFAPDGRRHGPYQRRLDPAGEGAPVAPWAEARIREERGTYDRGQAVGEWTFLDEAGEVVRSVRRGPAFDEAALDRQVFGERAGLTDDLPARLRAEGRLRDALVAAARVAARRGDARGLTAMLESEIVALRPELASEWGDALVGSTDLSVASALDALVLGVDPAAALRALAGALPATSSAAADCVEAALLLAPERRMTHLTRALIRLQRGEVAAALEDAEMVERASPESARGLREYAAVVFRPFDERPWEGALSAPDALAGAAAPLEELPVIEVAQPVAAVGRAVTVYATRLFRLRQALSEIVGGLQRPSWFPPDPAALLPEGPVALRRERVTLPCDGAEGAPELVEIDEGLSTAGLDVPGLLAVARADWAALSWLCWSIGLTRVAMPDEIRPPETLAAAMRLVVTRCWRLHDRLATGGLVARGNGVPGFEWQGLDVDLVPPHLAQMAAAEYLAVRAMFLWLASADVMSPFQTDLRDV